MVRPVKVLSISKLPSHIQRYLQIEAVVDGVPVRFTVNIADLQALETKQEKRRFLRLQALEQLDAQINTSLYQELIGDIDEGEGPTGKP